MRSLSVACRSAVAIAFVFAAACEGVSPIAGDGLVLLVTDASAYTALRDSSGAVERALFEMVVSVDNQTGREITLQACADQGNAPRFAVSMAATHNDWSAAYENALDCSAPSTLTLAVGESRVDRIELIGPRVIDAETGAPIGLLEGRMRLVYYVDGLNLWSNSFEVQLDSLP